MTRTPIEIKYGSLGGSEGFLGNPKYNKERRTADGVGRHMAYDHGHIFWHPDTGAHEVHGAILSKYASWGWAKGALGYPITDEMDTPDGGRYSEFQKGLIVWTLERGAQGIGQYGINVDPVAAFWSDEWRDSPYGNLQQFYENMRDWHGIDLKTNIAVQRNEMRYKGWQVSNFWHDPKLNGITMNPVERFVLSVARILIMQWHFRDLKNDWRLRRSTINRYFEGHANFKRNRVLNKKLHWEWHFNAWCSEFASYVYKAAGMPICYAEEQGFVAENITRYEKLDWCITRYSYMDDPFRDSNNWVPMSDVAKDESQLETHYVPQVGDYLRTGSHSMLVLGTEFFGNGSARRLGIYIVNGNSGSGAPQSGNKLVKVQYRLATDDSLQGIGKMNLSI